MPTPLAGANSKKAYGELDPPRNLSIRSIRSIRLESGDASSKNKGAIFNINHLGFARSETPKVQPPSAVTALSAILPWFGFR